MIGLDVIRPADHEDTAGEWSAAIKHTEHPTRLGVDTPGHSGQRGCTRQKDEISPRLDFNTTSFPLNDMIALEAILFRKRSFSALVMDNVTIAPAIFQDP